MSRTLQPSVVLLAQDLLNRRPTDLSLEDLTTQVSEVVAILNALDHFGKAVCRSPNAIAQVVHLTRKLHAHLRWLQERIEEQQAVLRSTHGSAADGEAEPDSARLPVRSRRRTTLANVLGPQNSQNRTSPWTTSPACSSSSKIILPHA